MRDKELKPIYLLDPSSLTRFNLKYLSLLPDVNVNQMLILKA